MGERALHPVLFHILSKITHVYFNLHSFTKSYTELVFCRNHKISRVYLISEHMMPKYFFFLSQKTRLWHVNVVLSGVQSTLLYYFINLVTNEFVNMVLLDIF